MCVTVAVDYCSQWIIINSTELVVSFFTTLLEYLL